MIDIIIPTHNDKEFLWRTLKSITPLFCADKIHVTVVDDFSDNQNYDDIKSYDWPFDIKVLCLTENKGPGMARQYGIDNTNHEYITFLDSGDTFREGITCDLMMWEAIDKPHIDMFVWPFAEVWPKDLITEAILNNENNYIFSKLFKREFLNTYNITFAPNKIASFAVEDIAFSRACRTILQQKAIE